MKISACQDTTEVILMAQNLLTFISPGQKINNPLLCCTNYGTRQSFLTLSQHLKIQNQNDIKVVLSIFTQQKPCSKHNFRCFKTHCSNDKVEGGVYLNV